jgi:transposase-like protein
MGDKKVIKEGINMAGTKALLTCPHCNASYDVEMPVNYYHIMFRCRSCRKELFQKNATVMTFVLI